MTSAYDKTYLEDAKNCLGEAVDYAANACGLDITSFLEMFVISGYASRFQDGDPEILAGTSGTELAQDILSNVGLEFAYPDPVVDYSGFSQEYVLGSLLAEFQWYSHRTFRQIVNSIPMEDLVSLAVSLLESDEETRTRAFDSLNGRFFEPVRLQTLRKECGYSQRQLAERSGVNIRTLQQYEIKGKDINKAAASTLASLARELGCEMEDIMEYAD